MDDSMHRRGKHKVGLIHTYQNVSLSSPDFEKNKHISLLPFKSDIMSLKIRSVNVFVVFTAIKSDI